MPRPPLLPDELAALRRSPSAAIRLLTAKAVPAGAHPRRSHGATLRRIEDDPVRGLPIAYCATQRVHPRNLHHLKSARAELCRTGRVLGEVVDVRREDGEVMVLIALAGAAAA